MSSGCNNQLSFLFACLQTDIYIYILLICKKTNPSSYSNKEAIALDTIANLAKAFGKKGDTFSEMQDQLTLEKDLKYVTGTNKQGRKILRIELRFLKSRIAKSDEKK